jgi:hypothetical protein
MATITKRSGRIVIEWNKDAPNDLRYFYEATAVVSDDSEKTIRVRLDNVGTRATFRALDGQQIEDNWKAQTDAALQAVGSGAGGHTIDQDWGN